MLSRKTSPSHTLWNSVVDILTIHQMDFQNKSHLTTHDDVNRLNVQDSIIGKNKLSEVPFVSNWDWKYDLFGTRGLVSSKFMCATKYRLLDRAAMKLLGILQFPVPQWNKITHRFPTVFNGLGQITGETVRIKTEEGYTYHITSQQLERYRCLCWSHTGKRYIIWG